MRVIGGVYRGRRLRTVGGLSVRPTSDRLRETLFNILAPRIQGIRFLDICAGSGAVGIEALSRGALAVTLIERSRHACAVIEANLNALGITSEVTAINRDAPAAIKRLEQESEQFDVVFFDPPYASEIYGGVMKRLGSGLLLAAGAVVVVEHLAKTPPGTEYGKLRLVRELKQGESGLAFYETASR
jgi:16S rRNA (guanine966-N2)-methyltransferase